MLIPLPLSPPSRRLSLSIQYNFVYGSRVLYVIALVPCGTIVVDFFFFFGLLFKTKLFKDKHCVLFDFAMQGTWLSQNDLLTNYNNSLSGLVLQSQSTGFKLFKHVFNVEPRCLLLSMCMKREREQ